MIGVSQSSINIIYLVRNKILAHNLLIYHQIFRILKRSVCVLAQNAFQLQRVRYCGLCGAYVKGFDHHCPAFGNCIGMVTLLPSPQKQLLCGETMLPFVEY